MKNLVVLFLLLASAKCMAQQQGEEVYDTARRMDPRAATQESLNRGFRFDIVKDSTMLFFQQYDRIKRENIGIQNLGDVSSPYINQLFRPYLEQGFIPGINPMGNIYFRNSQARFYDSKMPFTEFYYTQGKGGARGMIYFDAFHTQNFGRRFNIAARYHGTSNDGFYKRQSLSVKNVQVSTYYHSKNRRYLASGVFTWNKTNMMENGGLEQSPETDTLFRNLSPAVRIVNVELNNARNINRLVEYKLSQVYWLKVKRPNDTTGDIGPQIGISHTFESQRQSNYYTDRSQDYGFYDSVYYYNGNYSADSIRFVQKSNIVELFTPLSENGVSFRAGIRYDNMSYYQQADPLNYMRFSSHNISLQGRADFNFLKTFESEAEGRYYLEGVNQADYLLQWKNEAMLLKEQQISVNANISASARQPFFQQERMLSNHYKWNNNFVKTAQKTIEFGIDKGMKRKGKYDAFYYTPPPKALSLRASYTLLDNLVYFGQDGKPAQGPKGQNSLQLFGSVHFNLKYLQIHQELAYQVFSKELASELLLPDLISKTSLYVQTYAFKRATFVQIGLDGWYVNSYKARLYNPATLNFQVSDRYVGGYPFVDAFINAEVKTVRIFFKMEHINQGIGGLYGFPNFIYVSPYQPAPPRRFRLGFVWKFYY